MIYRTWELQSCTPPLIKYNIMRRDRINMDPFVDHICDKLQNTDPRIRILLMPTGTYMTC